MVSRETLYYNRRYDICSIRQLIYDLTRHLLYKHILQLSNHIKTILLCLRFIKHVTILPTASLFRQLPGDSFVCLVFVHIEIPRYLINGCAQESSEFLSLL